MSRPNIHKFGDVNVETERHPSREYSARDADNYDLGFPVGWGYTEIGAIADFFEQMVERGFLPAQEAA